MDIHEETVNGVLYRIRVWGDGDISLGGSHHMSMSTVRTDGRPVGAYWTEAAEFFIERKAKSVLLIGGGFASTARELRRLGFTGKIGMVEPDRTVIRLCKRFAGGYEGFVDEIFPMTGDQWAAREKRALVGDKVKPRWDWCLVDAYTHGENPKAVYGKEEFLRMAGRLFNGVQANLTGYLPEPWKTP